MQQQQQQQQQQQEVEEEQEEEESKTVGGFMQENAFGGLVQHFNITRYHGSERLRLMRMAETVGKEGGREGGGVSFCCFVGIARFGWKAPCFVSSLCCGCGCHLGRPLLLPGVCRRAPFGRPSIMPDV